MENYPVSNFHTLQKSEKDIIEVILHPSDGQKKDKEGNPRENGIFDMSETKRQGGWPIQLIGQAQTRADEIPGEPAFLRLPDAMGGNVLVATKNIRRGKEEKRQKHFSR